MDTSTTTTSTTSNHEQLTEEQLKVKARVEALMSPELKELMEQHKKELAQEVADKYDAKIVKYEEQAKKNEQYKEDGKKAVGLLVTPESTYSELKKVYNDIRRKMRKELKYDRGDGPTDEFNRLSGMLGAILTLIIAKEKQYKAEGKEIPEFHAESDSDSSD